MTYPGNNDLSPEIRRRVDETFQQTLELAAKGSSREALLGCDFILRLDPLFEPARVLQQRLQGGGEVATDDLQVMATGGEPSAEPASEPAAEPAPGADAEPPSLSDLGSIDLDLSAPRPAQAAEDPLEDEIDFDEGFDEGFDAPTMRIETGEVEIFVPPPAKPPSADVEAELDEGFDAPTMKIDTGRTPAPPPGETTSIEIETDPGASFDAPTMKIDTGQTPVAPPGETTSIEIETDPGAHPDAPTMKIDTGQTPVPQPGETTSIEIETDPGAHPDAPTMKIDTGVDEVDLPTMKLDPVPTAQTPAEPEAEPEDAPTAQKESDLDSESEQRIRELLTEGQAALDAGEPQRAIDAWSRIFLIDIDHEEATERIEGARKVKAEIERSLEASLHEGLAHLEAGELEEARAAFERVLEEEPNHNEAREQLEIVEQLEKGETPAPPPQDEAPQETGEDKGAAAATGAAEERPKRPATDESEGPRMAPMQAATETKGPGRLFIIIGSVVLLLVLVGGWFVFSNRSRLFPNAAGSDDGLFSPITHAEELYDSGQTAMAISQLQQIPEGDPSYEEAQQLISRMQRAPAARTGEFQLDDTLAERAEVLTRARAALVAGDLIEAEALYAEAAELATLDGEDAANHAELESLLQPVRGQIEVFRQGEWEYALRDLWRIHQEQPESEVVVDLMIDCYYNLGVRELQRGDATAAAEMFSEATKLRGGDPQLERLARFADTYSGRSQDLLYRIFVKYLPFR